MTLEDATKEFGKLLRAACDFKAWRGQEAEPDDAKCTYLGPNCCKVGQGKNRDCAVVSVTTCLHSLFAALSFHVD